jgi:hypothetical protein
MMDPAKGGKAATGALIDRSATAKELLAELER